MPSASAASDRHADPRHERRLVHLGQLAGGLAHEIKNPLSTIGLNLELLLEDWAGDDSPKAQRTVAKLRVLQGEVRRLDQILEDFLDFARGSELNLQKHDLVRVVTEVLDFLEPEFQRARITLWQPDISVARPLVPLDRDRFKQALLNLLRNAQQAMPGGGEITVRVERDGPDLVLDISDTGEGVAAERWHEIFDVYVSHKQGGTGLGLPTARRIVEEHGGTLELVASEPGLGSLFRIRLPLATDA